MIMAERYAIGEKSELGSYVFTSENIIHFAERFDPQTFHLDAEAAKASLFGGLCASGWHTCAVWMRMFLIYWEKESARLASEGILPPRLGPSPGFIKLQWLRPVFAGEEVAYSVTFLASRSLSSKQGRRLNTILCEGRLLDGTPVIRFESTVIDFE
ncbi:MaoC/PaaZ C-terminal domain-containing protein [Rhizobium sp. Root1220]|uniref:MaoC/PaaZ C-terminal domain-containing protein n=1 Tax=Rhizobium sp. Root1220 TaxID=1736432 RepID=UPI0006FBA5A5|nr:MaoC/PaaZ C-terminal domain-containing protein [Rhizobium sp. Root1220]KQV64513.1 dehydratase [Rhizobium sp. Root1220]